MEFVLANIDKTILDLISLLFGTAGIFSVLVKYSVPQLNQTYIGSNPHGLKRDVIDSVTTKMFLFLALIGIFIQAISIIKGDSLPRQHSERWYIMAFLYGIPCILVVTYVFGKLARIIAQLIWKPKIAKEFVENLDYLHFMIGSDTAYAKAYIAQHNIQDKRAEESLRNANLESARQMVADLENLFEIKNKSLDWKLRLTRISPYIERYFEEDAIAKKHNLTTPTF